MISIRGPTDLSLIADRELRSLVALRMSQLGDGEPYDPQAHGELYVAEEGDTAETLEASTGVFITTNPLDSLAYGHPEFVPVTEAIESHATAWELTFQLSDESAVGIFILRLSCDPELNAFCTAFAVPAVD